MSKIYKYSLKMMLSPPDLVMVNKFMKNCDLGTEGIYQEYEMTFTTTTKWNNKKVKILKYIFEANGWQVGKHILTEVISE